jgi:hypothetical protein
MPQKYTLKKLIDHLILESQGPFTTEEFVQRIQKRWPRTFSKSTLGRVKRNLSDHDGLIGMEDDDFLPFKAVLKKIGHLSLYVEIGKMEWDRRVFIPGHRMIPYLPPERLEKDLVFLDPEGREIPKLKQSFYIDEVIHFYHYSGERHFPDEINVNEWMPVKSSLGLTVWDLSPLVESADLKWGDGLRLELLNYEEGIFQVQRYSKALLRTDQLKRRTLNVALESVLARLYCDESFHAGGLQKQILHGLFLLEPELIGISPFSLTNFLESLEELAVVSYETGAVQLAPAWTTEPAPQTRKESPRVPKGETGSLKEIFKDLGLAFQATEFKAILYAVMGSDRFKLEVVFLLLFSGEGKLFLNKKQHNAFYSHLRKLLNEVTEGLKTPEPRLLTELREKCVLVKLGLIGILRFLEGKGVGLEDLPAETLVQVMELDQFCVENLSRLSRRGEPPDLKFIGDLKLSLKFVLPHLNQLEEEVYHQLGFY